ncbi:hypothetical protein BG011_000058 [Mortierella polycephala]|uniref:Uncharacterized protein n=1 Tax=Mortierella polycephala TaxID=41804 RepID=A0A9P6UAU2_9FUNG|nr:hypothetical protein BG011_000058 [Mortierella polycephala]
MSSFDPSNPYDNGQPWQTVPSTPAWQRNTANSSTATPELATLSTNDAIPTAAPTAPVVQPPFAPIPSTSATAPSSSSAAAAAATATAIGAGASHTPVATAASATAAAKQPAFDDEPPSYEASVIKDVPQIHDNYDHLRGPPGQRGVDLKTRIPPDSTPASHYQSGAQGSSSVGAAGSSNEVAGSSGYGAIPQHPPHANLAQPSAPNILQGQISQGREDDEVHEQDMSRLLGASNDHQRDDLDLQHDYSDTESEEPDSHWSVVGDGKAWLALSYIVVVLLPWALFCFIWTLVTLIVASVSLIIPPLGYVVSIATVTSWRALARVDLVMSRAMVSRSVRQRYPHETYNVFVTSESMTSPHYRRRRPKNMWHRGSKHLKSTVNNKHTVKSMFYFLVWKLFYALPIFIVVIVFAVLTVPFMFCLLPTLLILSRALINWQFRWAVVWLTEKPQAIALP